MEATVAGAAFDLGDLCSPISCIQVRQLDGGRVALEFVCTATTALGGLLSTWAACRGPAIRAAVIRPAM